MNLTLVNLYTMHLSLAPLFIGKRSLTLSKCGFSRFFSTIVFNSWARISQTTFKHGLASAIYVDSSNRNSNYTYKKGGKLELSGVNFVDITEGKAVILFDCPDDPVTLTGIGVTTCRLIEAGTKLIVVDANSLTASSVCVFNSYAEATKGLWANTAEKTDVSMMTVYNQVLSGGDFTAAIEVSAGSFSIATSNVTGVAQTSADGCASFRLDNRNGTGKLQDICVLGCQGKCGFDYSPSNLSNATFDALNFILNKIENSIMSFSGECVVRNSYLVKNSNLQAGIPVHFENTGSGVVTLENCVIDSQQVRMTGSFTGGVTSTVDTATSEFYGLNTMGCVAPVRPDLAGFFENFTTEEIIANVVCVFGLLVAIFEIGKHFLYDVLCEKKNKDESEDEGGSEGTDEEEESNSEEEAELSSAKSD